MLVITKFQNRKSSLGTRVETTWEEFTGWLKTATITSETLDEYQSMTNEQRTDIKDVGGYVAGEFINNRRSKSNIISRWVLAIDADNATVNDKDDYDALYDYKYFVHTTHTSTEDAPRYRWLFPLSRSVTSAEYRMLVAEAKLWVGADTIDESTDQPERLMFWPSVCLDADYFWWEGGTSLLNPNDFIKGVMAAPEIEKPSTPVLANDDVITEGQRNKAVFSFAADLRRQGLDKEIIRSFLTKYNDTYCDPPLPSHELDLITGSVCKYAKGDKIRFEDRDFQSDFSDLGEMKKPDKKYHLETVDGLLKEDIPDPEFIIKGILSVGLGALTAPPKFGKSWMCLDIAISVTTGTDFLGFPTKKSEVIYLALEDGKKRLQSRTVQVGGDPSRLEDLRGFYFSREAPNMTNDSLLTWLQEEVEAHPKVKLIIIDTLQKIRGVSKKNEGVYGYDYRELGEIQKFAIDHELSVLLIHHTRKGVGDGDFLENLSGSNGISGALDYSWVLSRKRRKDDTTLLDITGRDIPTQSYVIQFNSATYRWENLGEEKEVRESSADKSYVTDPLVRTIKHYLTKAEEKIKKEGLDSAEASWSVTSQELLDAAIGLCGIDVEYEKDTEVGKRISDIRSQLEHKDGITYRKTRPTVDGKQVYVYNFSRAVVP